MYTVLAAAITAVFTLLAVVIVEIIYGKRIFSKLEKHDESDDKFHNTLSKEHYELKNNSDNILKLNTSIASKILNIDKILFAEKETKKLQLESLSDKQKEMKSSLDKLVGYADELEKVSLQNARLWRENESLRQENEELRIIIRRQKDKIIDLEHDYEYER